MILKQNLEEILTRLERKQKSVNMELAEYPEGTLGLYNQDGKLQYFHITKTGGKRIRRSINKNPEMIRLLARKQYLQSEAELLEQNRAVVKKALASICDMAAENILSRMPLKYRKLSRDAFFQAAQPPENLMTEGEKWANAPYKQSDFLPEKKVHLTSRGLAVRSKSEVIIAEKLYELQIPFRYEEEMIIEKYHVSADFTMYKYDGELFYLEHCGMPGNKAYMKRHKWKVDLYETVGIVPWKNLIVTYDDEMGNLNLKSVENELRSKLL